MISKPWIMGITLGSVTSLSLAGSMGEQLPRFNGFWGGVGGSYTYSTLNGKTNITQIDTAPSSATYILSNNILNHMAPMIDAGYFFSPIADWYVGPKFLYQYIGQEQFDQTWTGTYQDGSYQSAGLRTKSIQNFSLLLNFGYQMNEWLPYLAVGPGWAEVSVNLNGSVLPATSLIFTPVNISHKKTIIGGAAQVGFEYQLPKRFMVDISYNFLATPTTAVSTLVFPASNTRYANFNQSVNVVEQGINITLNKYFG